MRASILAAAAMLASATPAAAQQTPDPDAAAAGAGETAEPGRPQAPAPYSRELQGFAAEEFYWMNPEADRWPDDLDPRDNEYLPSPEPTLTFELDLDL